MELFENSPLYFSTKIWDSYSAGIWNKYNNIKPLGCLKVPLMLISIKNSANYLVNHDEQKNTIFLESDVKPVFYNEKDVLKCMTTSNR